MNIEDEILHSAFCYSGWERLVLKLILFLTRIHKYVDAHNLATESLQALKNATLSVHNYTELPTQKILLHSRLDDSQKESTKHKQLFSLI